MFSLLIKLLEQEVAACLPSCMLSCRVRLSLDNSEHEQAFDFALGSGGYKQVPLNFSTADAPTDEQPLRRLLARARDHDRRPRQLPSQIDRVDKRRRRRRAVTKFV